MIAANYSATAEQEAIINRTGSAFVTACPGAGKTRTMVERARRLLSSEQDRRGVAFLSFTTAAVDELQTRLRAFNILPTPLFPSFIGTFDSFVWHFFMATFGVVGSDAQPRLIPDKDLWDVKPPFENSQSLPLGCFNRATAKIIPEIALTCGFDTTKRNAGAHEKTAARILERALADGKVDFEDVRACVAERLKDKSFADRLGAALAARFREIVVDEAQDCNPADLEVVDWLRASGIPISVICDPNQAIYEFRGGVTDELRKFSESFDKDDRLGMTGNFRSTPAICSAIAMLRPPADRAIDKAAGPLKDDGTAVHILAYSGKAVPSSIGPAFAELACSIGAPLAQCPIVASSRDSAFNAIGQPPPKKTAHRTILLADAVTNYHFSFAIGDRRQALAQLHKIVLLIQGHLEGIGYYDYVHQAGRDRGEWRPEVIDIARALEPAAGETHDQWLAKARAKLEPALVGSTSIGSRLKKPSDWGDALQVAPNDAPPARTIHSVKGLEFPAVCVVMTSTKTKGILTYLEGGSAPDYEEQTRKIYVAASRAQRLLAIAIPKGQAGRLDSLLKAGGCTTLMQQL